MRIGDRRRSATIRTMAGMASSTEVRPLMAAATPFEKASIKSEPLSRIDDIGDPVTERDLVVGDEIRQPVQHWALQVGVFV